MGNQNQLNTIVGFGKKCLISMRFETDYDDNIFCIHQL